MALEQTYIPYMYMLTPWNSKRTHLRPHRLYIYLFYFNNVQQQFADKIDSAQENIFIFQWSLSIAYSCECMRQLSVYLCSVEWWNCVIFINNEQTDANVYFLHFFFHIFFFFFFYNEFIYFYYWY